MNNNYQDEKVVKALREQNPALFSESSENNIDNLYIVVEGERIDFASILLVNNRIEMTLPTEFKQMSEELANLKFLSSDRPEYIYSNDDTTFGVSFSIIEDKGIESLQELRDIVKEYTMKLNPGYKLMESGSTIKSDIPYFALITDAIDDKICNYIFFINIREGILMGTINKPEEDYSTWKDIFLQMIDSVSELGE